MSVLGFKDWAPTETLLMPADLKEANFLVSVEDGFASAVISTSEAKGNNLSQDQVFEQREKK